MKQPTLETLQKQVDDWNASHPIGTPVTRYKLINPLREGTETKTRSAASVIGNHSAVVWVEGVAGCVLLESVVPIPDEVPSEKHDRELTISIDRASKSWAVFDGFDLIKDFLQYTVEARAEIDARAWVTARSTKEPKMAYPSIKSIKFSR